MVVRNILVVTPDARRVSIKVSSEDPMIDVLDRACRRLNLSTDSYIFRSNKTQLDLSNTFGALRLPAGASLDLVRKSATPSAVSVALQLPPLSEILASSRSNVAALPENRLVHVFRSDTALWQVLRQFEDVVAKRTAGLEGLNLTSRGIAQMTAGTEGSGSGQVFWEAPVLVLMRKEVTSLADYQKTLSQLGYNSGRVLMRLHFRRTEKPLAEAMAEVQEYFAEEDAEPSHEANKANEPPEATKLSDPPSAPGNEGVLAAISGSVTEAVHEAVELMTSTADSSDTQLAFAAQADISPTSQPVPTQQPNSSTDTPTPDMPPITRLAVYSPTSSTTIHAAQTQDPDSAFTPTIAQVQLHQSQLLVASHNRRLPSDDEIAAQAAERAAKLARVSSVEVKVRFPDNWAVDWSCSADASGSHLYRAVRQVMAAAEQPFQLVLPDRTVVRDLDNTDADGDDRENRRRESLITGYKLAGRVLVNFTWHDSVPASVRKGAKDAFLKESIRQQAQTLVVPDAPPDVDDEVEKPTAVPPKLDRASDGNSSGTAGGKKVPKWLKLGK